MTTAFNFVLRPQTEKFIFCVIVFNALILGLETSPEIMASHSALLHLLDNICLGVFTLEIALKFCALRAAVLKNGWNIFDIIVVSLSFVPDAGFFTVLRVLRVLRIFRLITSLKRLRIVVEAILFSLPSIGWIVALQLLIFYVFAIMTTTIFGAAFPEWFGSIGDSLYTLFQIMTLESWSMGIARPVMETYPLAFAVFIPFILICTFVTLNAFVGIVVNAISEISARTREADNKNNDLRTEIANLKEGIANIERIILKQAESSGKAEPAALPEDTKLKS